MGTWAIRSGCSWATGCGTTPRQTEAQQGNRGIAQPQHRQLMQGLLLLEYSPAPQNKEAMSLVTCDTFVTYIAQCPSPFSLHNANLVSNLDEIIANTYKKFKKSVKLTHSCYGQRHQKKMGASERTLSTLWWLLICTGVVPSWIKVHD